MAAEYKTYLAAGILTEDKVITYRLLSRALKIHVNTAKEMLFEFHRQQNAKKPGTVHATYLLSGTKREEPKTPSPPITKDGEDDYMQSSPFITSSMPEHDEFASVFTTTISLVREEDLENVKSQYETVTSIHVYSLGPHSLKDVQLLSDSIREIQGLTAEEDPIKLAATYGTIINPLVKRRANRRPVPVAASKAAAQVVKTKPVEPIKPTTKSSTSTKPDGKGSQSAAAKDFFGKGKEKSKVAAESGPGSNESTPAPPAKLKKESSSIFKSFAKTPKVKRENTDSAAEDVSMKGMDDEDDEEETYVPPVQVKKEKAKGVEESAGDRKSRKEREAALKSMMEESDEEEAIPTPGPEEEETVLEKEKPVPEPEPVTTVSGGRRRGRRRVTKKKTVKDDEGYLVTKEETVWESFSEDEPVAPAPKPKLPAAGSVKGKKGAGKPGQGNIMSFFGKKA